MQGLTLSPMFFIAPAILGRAGLYTAGAVGGISYVGATADSEKYLWIGGPLMAGLGILILANLAPMLMPRMALRTLTTLETVGAYGGVAAAKESLAGRDAATSLTLHLFLLDCSALAHIASDSLADAPKSFKYHLAHP
ncbi:hypothetical protein JCM8097_000305 [Rhodosporidiobolus ruineniae]